KQVVVVGDGCEAWDAACAISLLNEGRDVQLMLTATPAASESTKEQEAASDGAPQLQCNTCFETGATTTTGTTTTSTATIAATTMAATVVGSELLDEARRRALQAALQPHYMLPAPGPLGRALRAP
ncbi:hypothetical protein Vretifemale_21027, partial [Volvox reticuliferus]